MDLTVTDSGQHTLLEAPTWAEVQRMRGVCGHGQHVSLGGRWGWFVVLDDSGHMPFAC